MKHRLAYLTILLFFSFVIFAQEKRIALVIGNANYSNEAILKNPINDALLMQSTLQKLGFDVMIETDIETHGEFVDVIEKYNEARKKYNIGMIYYAGHAVQINGENYMLATKEKYESESNIKYKGLDIKIFSSEWNHVYQNEINVLILDACRNNPFEKKIFGQTRDIKSAGLGLAQIKTESLPAGSLVAFSTAAGYTASDAFEESQNSLYCQSLAKNLLLEDVSIRNVFGKVSKEVYKQTGQYPELSDKMFDVDFYLIKSTFQDQILEIDSLIENDNFDLANEKTLIILGKSPNNKAALLRKGRIEYRTKNSDYDGAHLFKADSLYPKDIEVVEYLSRYYSTIGEIEIAIDFIDKAIKLDQQQPKLYYWKARIYEDGGLINEAEKQFEKYVLLDKTNESLLERFDFFKRNNLIELAIGDLNMAIERNTKDPELYSKRADMYLKKELYQDALGDLNKTIELSPNNSQAYINRGDFYSIKSIKTQDEKRALNDYEKAIEIAHLNLDKIRAYNNRALIYSNKGNYELAISELTKAINIDSSQSLLYSNRADNYSLMDEFEKANKDYTTAINISLNPGEDFYNRFLFQLNSLNEKLLALSDINEAIKLEPDNIDYLYARGNLWLDNFDDSEKAIEDLSRALEIDPGFTDAINALGIVYVSTGDTSKAFKLFNEGISHEKTNKESASFCYRNRADLYITLGNLINAESDLTKAIELAPSIAERYYDRAFFYLENKEDYKACIENLDNAINLDPSNINFLYARGSVQSDYLLNNKNAIQDFEKILLIDSTNIDAINAIGLIYFNQGQNDLAIERFNRGLKLEKLYPESTSFCYLNRALVHVDDKQYDKALQDFNKAIGLNPTEIVMYSNRADFYKDVLKQPYDALVDYSIAISIDSSNVYNWFMRGQLFSNELNDHISAIKDYQYLLNLDSNDVSVLNWLGVFYGRIREDSLELEYYNRTISKDGDSANDIEEFHTNLGWAYNNLAYALQKQNDNKGSFNYYSRAIELDPKEVLRYYERAWFSSLYLNDFDSAIEDIDRALEINKNDPYYILQRAKLNFLYGENKKAKKDFEKAIELADENEYYLLEYANFLSETKDNVNANKVFLKAHKSDSLSAMQFHFKTAHLMRNEMWKEATINAQKSVQIYDRDTLSYFQLGNIFLKNKEYQKALDALKTAEDIIIFSDHQKEIDASDESQIFLSDIQNEITDIYIILNEHVLACTYRKKAIESLENETRSKKEILRNQIKQKEVVCNN